MGPRRFKLKQSAILAASVQLAFSAPLVWGNPTGPQVVNGSATFQKQGAGTLNVTNAPGTIINWQGFSIGASEVTRFIQNSASSAVLNRVVGPDISSIQGQLLSNGRVFLINPAGIVIGPGAMIDTAGFVGSTLNMLDADFLAGKLKFQGDSSSGSLINQGWIRTSSGGQVILVAPNIENSGLIQTPGGELILAAGKSMTIGSLQHEGVQFEIQAPSDSVLNVGKLLADGGAVGVFAGTLRHSGEIRANALVRDEGGNIVLKAANDIQIAAGSITSANGRTGGSITIESTNGHSRIAGQVTATGSDGKGGDIRLLGDRVTATDGAQVDASGSAGGGQILLGGDYQGNNPAVRNATNTFVGATATLRADATQAGDGGRIIVWSDDKAQFYGNLSARGGPSGGNGGFAEVSGKQNLIFAGGADLSAPLGASGSLLLDPLDLYVFAGGGLVPSIIDENTDFPSNAATVSPATLAAIAGNVTLFASRYMRISDPVVLNPGQSLTASVGTWTAPALPDPIALDTVTPNRLDIAANITTAGGAVTLTAPSIQAVAASTIATAGGAINLNATGAIQASLLSLNAGAGAITVLPGSFLQLGTVTGGSFTATTPSFISIGGLITTSGGAVSLTSTGSSVTTSAGVTTSGGGVILTAAGSANNFGTIAAGGGAVSMTGSSVSGGTIDTTGAVSLTGTSSSVSATVNNSSSLTSTAGFGVTINSSTDLNVATVTAGSTGTASLSTTNGTIRATSDASKITGFNVTLQTGALTGGGIVGATQPLNVEVQRLFTFRPNGTFDVALTGTGPNGLNVEVGVAPATQSYSGTLTGPGLVFNASANDNTVTFNNLAITSGFDQRVAGIDPSITFRVPNGALIANSVTVPTGDTVSTLVLPNGIPLPVSLSAFGDLTLSSYTRAGGGLTKSTSIVSNTGNVTLGTIDASKDNVSISNSLFTTISSLITTGNVTISSAGTQAQSDSAALEINAGGTIFISSSGSIGTAGFTNPLDLSAAAISLQTINSGSMIGDVTGPVIANTENLTIDAQFGQFNVSTGATALKNLTLTADPFWVGNGGLAQVRTEAGGANDKTYTFASDGTDFTLAIGTVPVTQFSSGNFNVTSQSGNINLTGNTVFGTGNLNLTANGGGIFTSGSDISAANITLTATGTIDADFGALTATGTGGNITLRADTSIISGNLNAPGSITIDRRFCCSFPTVSVGDIGAITSPQTISINGTSVEVGAVTGAGDITLNANSGLLTLGGAVTTADGSTVTLKSTDNVNSLSFSKIDAGLTGTVSITSSSNIIQTSADAAGNGITAENVTLTATSNGLGLGEIRQTAGGSDGHLDLFGVKNLTFSTGNVVQLNAQGSTLTDLRVSRNEIPDNSSISVINLGSGQIVDLSGSASTQDLNIVSPGTPLNFRLDYFTGGDIALIGTGINTSGGSVDLRSSGGIDATTGGITTTGGNVYLEASGGLIDTGTINASGGAGTGRVEMWNFAGIGTSIEVSGNVTAGSAGSVFMAATGGSIIRTGGSVITAGTSATVSAGFGNLGDAGTPLLITAPSVTLSATGNPTSLCTSSGCAFATLTGTSNLTLTAYDGFNVSSDTAFATLNLTTRGFGYGTPGNSTLNLSAAGQTYLFDRPATDLFSNPIANTFQVVSVVGPTTATFATNTGDLLVAGGAGTFNIPNLSFFTSGSGDLKFQGTSGNSLSLNNASQSFSAGRDLLISGTVNLVSSGSQNLSSGQDLLVTGDVDVIASGNQTLQATRHLTVTANGGSTVISGSNQTFTTSSGVSKMEFLGGANAGESVVITSTNNQTVNSTSSSLDAFKLQGGSGSDASVTFTHSGAGVQDFQISNGTVTVAGGSGTNAFAKIEETGTNQQQLCRNLPFFFCGGGINTLNVLGGSGAGAFAQITAAGSQVARISSATNVKAGTGSGAYALIQAGTTQTFFQAGNLTVEGGTNAATTAKAEILAGSTQSISGAGTILVKGGAGADSLARIATTANQSISGTNLTLTAGGTEISPIAGASAIVEGGSQSSISVSSLTLNGGAGTGAGTTSDALLRTLTGSQTINATTITLNGGHQFSTAGILNQGTGTQSVTGSSGITLTSDLNGHSDSFVLIRNTPATQQTISASNGSLRLNNRGGGTVSISSGGAQTVTAGAVEVLTNSTTEPGPGISTISATGNQWIRTLNGTLSGFGSMRVAALGAGTASIESGASQLIQLDYPEQMQFARDGSLAVGDVNAAGTSRIKAVDQTIFAKSIVVQSGLTNSLSEIKASNNQVITTLNGAIQVLGGSGDNTLAQIDPVTQTILVNGGIDVQGGSGVNSVAQIVASTGTIPNGQTIYATNGDITLTGGTAAGAAALITNLGSSSFVGASGDIVLTAGTQPGADAIIGVGGGPGVLTLLCGGSCVLPPVGATPTAGILANQSPATPSTPFDTTSTLIALQQDQDEARFDAAPDETAEESADVQRAPICQ